METIRIRVFGKLNLFLRILGKRPDGYHEVDTLMHPVGLSDELQASKENHHNGLLLECDSPEAPSGPENTVFRAYQLLKERFPEAIGSCRIRIQKGIPTQGGMGGASADAAGAILAVERLFGLRLTDEERIEIGSAIGSDVAFFFGRGPAIAVGRGEQIRPIDGRLDVPVVLAVSREGVSTAAAYKRYEPDPAEEGLSSRAMEEAVHQGNAQEVSARLFNTFERLIYPLRPDLARIRLSLLAAGASGALMTGSGATIFALGMDAPGIARAQAVLRQMEREMICTTLQPWTYQWVE